MSSEKASLRRTIRAARREFVDKEAASKTIVEQVLAMPTYRDAKCVLWYLDVRDEVRTLDGVRRALSQQASVAIPWCDEKELRLFRLRDLAELETGRFGILEPRVSLRFEDDRLVNADSVDVTLVPGVAFDLSGGRLGHGAGFYDRFLSLGGGTRVGLAFECQLVDAVPMADHDVRVDWLVTESRVWDCRRGLGVHVCDSPW
ncbi:MAG: 5-formyltetrahydrofolate cyclo-ligase [Planctomycetota bacterium]